MSREENKKKKKHLPIILVVEDSDEDFFVIKRVFKELNLGAELKRFSNTVRTLDYLKDVLEKDEKPKRLPSIILLDLNLPGMDGKDLLEIIKGDERLKVIPIIVLTTSDSPSDIKECYLKGANSFQRKPLKYEIFSKEIKGLIRYWFETVTLPESMD